MKDSIYGYMELRIQKLAVLELLEEDNLAFKTLRRRCHCESSGRLFINLKALMEKGIIWSHPLLEIAEPTAGDVKQAKKLSISLKNSSIQVVLWAVTNDVLVSELSDEECLARLHKLALGSVSLYGGL